MASAALEAGPAVVVLCVMGFGEWIGGGARIGLPAVLFVAAVAAAAVDVAEAGAAPAAALDAASFRLAAMLYSSSRSCNC